MLLKEQKKERTKEGREEGKGGKEGERKGDINVQLFILFHVKEEIFFHLCEDQIVQKGFGVSILQEFQKSLKQGNKALSNLIHL